MGNDRKYVDTSVVQGGYGGMYLIEAKWYWGVALTALPGMFDANA